MKNRISEPRAEGRPPDGAARPRSAYLGVTRAATYGLFTLSAFALAGSELCAIVLLGCGAWELVRYRQHPGRLPGHPAWVLAAFLAYPAWVVFTALIHPDTLGGLDLMRSQYRVFLPLLLPLFLARVDPRRLVAAYGFFMLLMSLYAVLQYFTGVDLFRPEGRKLTAPNPDVEGLVFHGKANFGHHLTWAGAVLMTVCVATALALGSRGRWRWYWAGAAFACGLGLLASLGRSGWVGGAMGLLVLGIVWGGRVRWAAIGLGAATAALAALLLSGALPKVEGSRLGALVARAEASGLKKDAERLFLWRVAAQGARERPILGQGPARSVYADQRDQLAAREGITHFTFDNPMAHNLYLQLAFGSGVPAVLLYLALYAAVFARCGQFLRRVGSAHPYEAALVRGVIGALAGALVFGVFQNVFHDALVQTHIVMLMGLALSVTGSNTRAAQAVPRAKVRRG